MMRSHRAGDLRAEHVGQSVVVCGWAHPRNHGGKVFIDVRDVAGTVQVVIDLADASLEVAQKVRNEWVVKVVGDVTARPANMVNPEIATGEIEIVAREIEILNESEPPPFPLDD